MRVCILKFSLIQDENSICKAQEILTLGTMARLTNLYSELERFAVRQNLLFSLHWALRERNQWHAFQRFTVQLRNDRTLTIGVLWRICNREVAGSNIAVAASPFFKKKRIATCVSWVTEVIRLLLFCFVSRRITSHMQGYAPQKRAFVLSVRPDIRRFTKKNTLSERRSAV